MFKRGFDLAVIGGGINGAGIARDAAGRGLSVLLCEQHDLASHTSGASTKLIHGGLRYLEFHEFGLVRKALHEREILLRAAPHIIWPLRFVMPHDKGQRPAWMIRCGLFLYDHLARRELLPASEGLRLRTHVAGEALDPRFKRGFSYSDAWVQDSRLVVLNAVDAAARGATVLTRSAVVAASRNADHWRLEIESLEQGRLQVEARLVVNAAGPWVARLLGGMLKVRSARSIRLVKGSHIVVPRLFDHPFAYLFQNPDKRIIFAIPFETDFTLIGTTDLDYQGDPGAVQIEASEVAYLCDMVSRYFAKPVHAEDVVWSYSGVRPLLDDESDSASRVTRDYALELDVHAAPVLSVYGGKITTYRKLAEEAVGRVLKVLGREAPEWTAAAPLPGGDIPGADFDAFLTRVRQTYPWLPAALVYRYSRNYGSRIDVLLAGVGSIKALGVPVSPELYPAEIEYLWRHEYARTAEDILWRRSKLGLRTTPADIGRLQLWLDTHQKRLSALNEPGAAPVGVPV